MPPRAQFKCGLLQQLSDLTLRQNDEKSATLRSLLESESMLDAAVGQQQQQQHGGGGMEGDGWEGNGAGDLP